MTASLYGTYTSLYAGGCNKPRTCIRGSCEVIVHLNLLSGVITLQVTKFTPGTKFTVNSVILIRIEWSGLKLSGAVYKSIEWSAVLICCFLAEG